jgi:GT2 family glycosyltransferase
MELALSVIHLNYNSSEWLSKSLLEVINHAPVEGVEIIVVDNGSTDEDFLTMFEWWKKYKSIQPIRFVKAPRNLGFCGGMNFGVEHARGKNIFLLSNDVMVKSKNLFTDIMDMLEGNDKLLLGGRIIDWDSGWNTYPNQGHVYTIPYCEGYALSMSMKAWRELGGFDEQFYPHDFEDMDLSLTAMEHDFMLAQLDSAYLFHNCAGTVKYGVEREAITLNNQAKFVIKWLGKLPEMVDKGVICRK